MSVPLGEGVAAGLERLAARIARLPSRAALFAQPGFSLPDGRRLRSVPMPGGNWLLLDGPANAVEVALGADATGNLVIVEGVGRGSASLSIEGSGNTIVLRRSGKFQGRVGMAGSGHLFYWGLDATCNEGNFVVGLGQSDTTVALGEDCMLSQRVQLRAADSHGILALPGLEVVNPAGDIVVEPHVWLGNGVSVLKDVRIGAGSIVGTGALVTADLPALSTCAGVPARVLKTGTTWTRQPKPSHAEAASVVALLERCGLRPRG